MINAFYGLAVYGESSYAFTFVVSAAGTTIGLRTTKGALPTLKTKVSEPLRLNTSTEEAKVLLRSL